MKVLIPGCWGTAVYGLYRCTCERKTKPRDERDLVIKELKKENAQLWRIIKKLGGVDLKQMK